MIYAELGGYVAVGISGFVAGAILGRKLAADAAKVLHGLENRIAAVEHAASGSSATNGAAQAAATDHHAAAIEKLAGAIEKHAAAVDEHGAATVAAAVEGHALSASK